MDNGKVFIEELLKIKCSIDRNSEFVFDEESFKKAFLQVGSNTEENLDAIENIEYGKYSEERIDSIVKTAYGLKPKNKNVSICDVFFIAIECNDDILLDISNKYPELTNSEVESMLRMITIILSSLEHKNYNTINDF